MLLKGTSKKFGFDFYYDSHDKFVGEQIAADLYEPYESELFLSCLKEDSVLIDVGANIGYYSMLAAKKIKTGMIYAFEPNRSNFILLEMNTLQNRIHMATLLRKAVSNQRGSLKLYLSTANYGDHQLSYSADRESEAVDVECIDNFSSEYAIAPDVVKIDTQGYDYFVLLGMCESLQKAKNLILFTEFWMHGNAKSGVNDKSYYDFLCEQFDRVNQIDEENRTTYSATFDQIQKECSKYDNMNHVNLFCTKG